MKPLVRNKHAYKNFDHKETFVGGLKLSGAEVKSLKQNQGSLQGAYLSLRSLSVHDASKQELVIRNLFIPPYQIKNMPGGYDPNKDRIVLVTKREMNAIARELNNSGTTLIPITIGLVNNLVKIEFALARGKKMHDKREDLKKKAQKRDAERDHKAVLQ